GVKFAVRQSRDLRLSAEMEIGVLRISDRPAAAAFLERLNGSALGNRDYKLFSGRHIGLRILVEGSQSGVAHIRKARLYRSSLHRRGAHARAMAFHPCGGGAARQTEAVNFPDHRVACHGTDASCNLASAQTFAPKLLQELDSL